jgi:hypothetical protein
VIYFCCDQLRRNAVGSHPSLRGIDFLEVSPDQSNLFVHFVPAAPGVLKTAIPPELTADNITITGGEHITAIRIVSVDYQAEVLVVKVDDDDGDPAGGVGDSSIYTLELANVPDLDPTLTSVDFSFKASYPTDFDCQPRRICPPEQLVEPPIDYLAKDYASFRGLMLDRMAALLPQWSEQHVPDLGIALVELLAYVGDYLSYQQDAVATEAYLDTARSRISVRRHARLVDYRMHDGCNARAWVVIKATEGTVGVLVPGPSDQQSGTVVLTLINAPRGTLRKDQLPAAADQGAVMFETMHDLKLYAAHNWMPFYTWSDQRCCLPRGATRATLMGAYPHLQSGDVLIFAEVIGPETGDPDDADASRRHAVRLSQVRQQDSQGNALVDPLNNQPITEIAWPDEDALPFPFCISVSIENSGAIKEISDVSVAWGNVVLADHGLTENNPLTPATVPDATFRVPPIGDNRCAPRTPVTVPPRYRPQLADGPLTQAAPFDRSASATAAMQWRVDQAMPEIVLTSQLNQDMTTWSPQPDLLNSAADATEFVVEIEVDGTVLLRFGDDKHGRRPEPKSVFNASYRVGNGAAGNVGAETIAHLLTDDPALTAAISDLSNRLPAQGGVEPETMESARQNAPNAFRTQERAVTEADYADVAARDQPQVQRAAATFRWTGSWRTVFITVDPAGTEIVNNKVVAAVEDQVERYRMAGYDLQVDGPHYVSLEIDMHVSVKPDYFRSDVEAALLDLFSNRDLPDAGSGLFHPGNFTFGQPVYLSPLYAAAQAAEGVASVHITKFQRQGNPDPKPLDDGVLELGRLEIARLDNDPNHPERGVFRLTLGGGK